MHLIIDADDTLWENNIYFERAFDEFCDFLSHSTMTPREVRDVLDAMEKHADAYRQLVRDRSMHPPATWMIGNSPKSDVNPALEAGLNAVFVPHAHTWVLEKEEIRETPGRLLVVERFSALRDHF